jgi:serine/threonine protein kinase
MWALGIIVFQMLTGKHPFYKSGDTEESYTNRISKTELNKTLKIYF